MTMPVPSIVRLLVVDDDVRFPDYLQILLGRGHTAFEIDAVETVDDALRELSQGRHHVCLLDYRLGTEDGLDVLRAAQDRGVRTPIILLTGERDASLEFTALEEGAVDYLHKSEMDSSRLERLICRAIARHRADVALRDREARAEASEQRYTSMVRNAPYGIFEATIDGRFLAVNPALVAMLGFESEQDVLPIDPDHLFGSAESRVEVLAWLLASRGAGVETSWVRRDGSTTLVRISAHLVPGPVDVMTGVVEDITERKELEERFRQAHKMEAIGQLAGGVAHDFNNLLTAILGYADLLKDRCGDLPDARMDIEEIESAGKSAAALTEQLLAFSRKQVLKPAVVSVNSVLEGMQNLLSRILGEDVTLTTTLAPDAPPIEADPVQLQQVILNLAINARDAMPEGGRLIIETTSVEDGSMVRLATAPPAGRCVVITVWDSGCGMDAATRSRIFEPFFTTKAQGQGTGLGLATVYGIVKQTGGEIICESRPNAGTKFTILLPTTDKVSMTSTDTRALAADGAGTVLLVEDQAAVRRLARRILEKHGYRVLDAADPEIALLMAAETPIDVLVTDVVMPQLSGPELVRRVRQHSPDVPVLFMSGFAGHRALSDIGDSPFLHKPFTPEGLIASVMAAMLPGGRRPARSRCGPAPH